jgi:hypothetical protein
MWLEECTEPEELAEVETTELHRNFAAWMRSAEMKPWSIMAFSNAMGEQGYAKGKHTVTRRSVISGLAVRKTVASR